MDDYAVDNTTLSTVPHNNMSLSLSYGSALDYSSSLYTSPLAQDANDANHLHAYGGVCRVAPTALATTTVTPVAADGANSERVIAGFVAKLYQCLQTTENGESYARWCRHDGKDMFVIDCIPKFTEQVLPKLFKHCKFPSFVRQLNIYGFQRDTDARKSKDSKDKKSCRWYHPYFRPGRRDLFPLIRRKATQYTRRRRSKMIAGGGGGNHHPPNNHVVVTPESPSSLSQQHASPEVYATETTLPLHDSELGFSDVAMLYSTTSSLPPHDYAGLPPSASFEQHAHIPPPHPPSAPPVTHEVANMDAGGYVDSDFHHDLSSSSLPAAVVAAAANASAPPASDNYTSMIQHQQHQQWMHLHMSRSYMGNDLSWIMHQRRQHHHLNHQMSPTASPSTSSDKSKEINAVPTSSSPSSASASLNSSASSSPAVVAANPPPPSLAQRPPPLAAPTHMPSHNDLPFSSSASSSLTHTHSHHHPHHHQHHHPHPHHQHHQQQQQQQQQQPLHPSYVTHSTAVFAQQQPHHLAATQLETSYLPRTDHSSLLYSSDMISTSQPYTSLPIASSQSFSLDHPEWHPAQENSFF